MIFKYSLSKIVGFSAVFMLLSISGCTQVPEKKQSMTQAQKADKAYAVPKQRPQLPSKPLETQLNKRLDHHAGLTSPSYRSRQSLRKLDIAAADAEAKAFFVSLVAGTDVNMVVDPDVSGNITINLRQVTLEEALKAVRDAYGYDFIERAYGYQIVPRKLQSKIFPINYLNVSRTGRSSTSVSSGQITNSNSNSSSGSTSSNTDSNNSSALTVQSTQILTESKSQFWEGLEKTLRAFIGAGDGRKVLVDAESGMVVIKAFPGELRQVEAFLERTQLSLQRQVLIEAKVVEVSLGDGYQAGIQWDTFGLGYGGDLTSTTNKVVGSLASKSINEIVDSNLEGIFTLGLNFTDFTGVINLLESQGDVQVLSSPRIATVNNQKAVIKVGTDEFFVTEISNSTTSSTTTTVDSPEVTLTPFFSGIALDVTPHIGENAEVILHVHPTVTEVSERIKNIGVGNRDLVLPLAFSSIRETDSVIRARDGQIVIIGGLMQTKAEKKQAGIPLLSRIPGLGKLFMQERDVNKKSELVILLRPRVVSINQWPQDYELLRQRFPEDMR